MALTIPPFPAQPDQGRGAAPDAPEPWTGSEFMMEQENAQREGRDKKTATWVPHDSPEGGTDTLGYGHKITKEEVAAGKKLGIQAVVEIGGKKYSIDRENGIGLPDNLIQKLYEQDLRRFTDWSKQFTRLTSNQQTALTSLVYTMGVDGFTNPRGGKESKAWVALRNYNRTGNPEELAEFEHQSYSAEQGFTSRGLNLNRRLAEGKLSRTPDAQQSKAYGTVPGSGEPRPSFTVPQTAFNIGR